MDQIVIMHQGSGSATSNPELIQNTQRDLTGRPTSIGYQSNAGLLATYSMAYVSGSNRLASLTTPAGTTAYSYTANGQLTQAGSEAYTYDGNGNPVTRNGKTTQIGTFNRLLDDGDFTFQYDAEGRTTRRTNKATGETERYEWNPRSQLTKIDVFANASTSTVKGSVKYGYDTLGRRNRVSNETSIGTPSYSKTIDYLLSDGDQIGEILGATGQVTNRFMYGPGVDMVLSEQQFAGGVAQSPQYQLTDHLGTVRGVAQRVGGASSATLVNAVQYDAFGKVTSQSNATNQPHHGFAGRDIEPVGGLTYNRNRYYSTSSGRFISQDPIGFAAGDANLYRYVGNESTMYTDPSGLERSVKLPNGTVFVAQGTGHHKVPWSVFSDPKFNFSAEVMAVFDGGADNALVNGNWYNFHDGTSMGGIRHTDYNKAVNKELTKFKRGIKDFGPKHAEKFLNHLEGLDARHSIRVFNAGVTAERDLAHEIGDVLYKQYKKDAWFWTRDKTIKKRVLDEVEGYVRELRSSNVSKQKFLKDLVSDLSSKVPGKKIAGSVVKRLGSALFVWGVVDQITKDGRVNASEIPNAIVLNSPVLGDAIQAGLGLGHVFLYLQEECDNERTGDDWASSGTVYDPTNNNFITNYHGVTPN